MRSGIIGKIFLILLIGGLGYGYYYLHSNLMIERVKPNIKIDKKIYWNLKDSISVPIFDEGGIKFIKASVIEQNGKETTLSQEIFREAKNSFDLKIKPPKIGFFQKNGKVILKIEVIDRSLWNMLQGNRAVSKTLVTIDTKKPQIRSLTNSYSITKGGVGLVIFGAKDEKLKSLYIQTNYGKKFYPIRFYKDGYFTSLIAWPIDKKEFKATIVAIDKANNITKSRIRFYIKNKKYRESTITLNSKFLAGKIKDLAMKYKNDFQEAMKIQNFSFVNETLRQTDEKRIHKKSLKRGKLFIDNFNIKKFYPLKNAAAVASFGDHRFYKFEGKIISESYHLGLDLASVKNADIRTSNDGTVIYADETGIYGNSIIISHGLGVHTLYSHCNHFLVQVGEKVKAGQVIAKSGRTGLALGDHLHFGVLVQGVEVRPAEWMDRDWIRKNITSIINNAKYMIDNGKDSL